MLHPWRRRDWTRKYSSTIDAGVANIPLDEGGQLQMVDGQVHWIEYEPQNELETISVLFTAIPGTSAPVRL